MVELSSDYVLRRGLGVRRTSHYLNDGKKDFGFHHSALESKNLPQSAPLSYNEHYLLYNISLISEINIICFIEISLNLMVINMFEKIHKYIKWQFKYIQIDLSPMGASATHIVGINGNLGK
jgi:hypothetical protein